MTALNHLEPYRRPSNYIGATWFGYYDVAGRHRDSDTLTNSNFECWKKFLTELLGTENTVIGEDNEPQSRSMFGDTESEDILNWTVCRESHWAVGWVEIIRVHGSVGDEKLAAIDEKLHALDGYPVFDEQHFSDLEQQEYSNAWHHGGAREDFIRSIRRAFTEGRTDAEDYTEEDAILDRLDDVPTDRLIELHESLIPSGEYHHDCWPCIDCSIRAMEWDDIEAFINP